MTSSLSQEALFYRGAHEGQRRPLSELPTPVQRMLDDVGTYDPAPAVVRAANVALMLRMPLLLTGEPGVGKTRLAASVAGELGLPLVELTVSGDTGKTDMLYKFDELGRLRDAYAEAQPVKEGAPSRPPPPLTAYFSFRGLGLTILRAGGPEAPLERISAAGRGARFEHDARTFGDLVPDLASPGGKPPVLLIDEIDKAPRDLPNDLLTEFDRMQFDIAELGVRVKLPPDAPWPIVVITSNSERTLPEPFLRRCVYHHIEFPTARLADIIGNRLRDLGLSQQVVADATEIVGVLRAEATGISRKPGLSEILGWLRLLTDRTRMPTAIGAPAVSSLRALDPSLLEASLAALLKTQADIARGAERLREEKWLPQSA